MRLLCLLVLPVIASAQPPGQSPVLVVRNAATNVGRAAPGSFISIFLISFPFTAPNPDDTLLEVVTSGGQTFQLPTTQKGDLWAVLPNDAAVGAATATLVENNVRQASTIFEIAATAPGVFTKENQSFGPALALNYYGGANTASNGLTAAAVPDRYVALFATGLNGAGTSDVTVEIAGQPVLVTYAGPQGDPGLDQINFLMPANPHFGCYVPVLVRVRGVLSNEVTLSIHTDSYACAHPLGLSYPELQTLDAGGAIPFTQLNVFGGYLPGTGWTESAQFLHQQADAARIFLAARTQVPDSVYLGCSRTDFGVGQGAAGGLAPRSTATLSGPGGQQAILNPFFNSDPAGDRQFFSPGVWQVFTDDFRQSFTLPPGLTSINIAPGATIARDHDLQIQWNPVGFSSGDIATINLTGVAASSNVVCRTHAWAGQLTVPKELLAPAADGRFAFPPGTPGSVTISVAPHPAARTQFSIVRPDGPSAHAVIDHAFSLSIFPVKAE